MKRKAFKVKARVRKYTQVSASTDCNQSCNHSSDGVVK